jgi:hypothetical protein
VFPVYAATDGITTALGEYIIETSYTEMFSVLGQSVLDLVVAIDGMNVNTAFIEWIQAVAGEETLGDYFTTDSAGFRTGLDGYSRILFGVHGIKLDNVVGVCLESVTVMSITNSGRLGFQNDLTLYSGEDPHIYVGAIASGVTAAAVCGLQVSSNMLVYNILAENGDAFGWRFLDHSTRGCVPHADILLVQAGMLQNLELDTTIVAWRGESSDGLSVEYCAVEPNYVPNAYGVAYMHLASECVSEVTMTRTTLDTIIAAGVGVEYGWIQTRA